MLSPLRFGPTGRQLFGLFQTPPANVDRRHSVLICNPFGQEYIRCHRLLRAIADRLTRVGFHVLRFDYFGTGDSDGDDADGNLTQWQDDVILANAEVLKLSGHSTTSWLGLRLGGSIAAAASVQASRPPNRLAVWDPVTDGMTYLQELEAAHAADIGFLAHWNRKKLEQVAAASAQHEVLGFPISAALRQQIVEISPSTFSSARTRGLDIFCNKSSRDYKRLEQFSTIADAHMRLIPIQTQILWASNEAMNSAIVPAEALNGIVESLSEAA